ncbi:MAG: transposase, partial [Acidobacteriota bacterium]
MNYFRGLLWPIERQSVEPMDARLAPHHNRRMHQSQHRIVADAPWSSARREPQHLHSESSAAESALRCCRQRTGENDSNTYPRDRSLLH